MVGDPMPGVVGGPTPGVQHPIVPAMIQKLLYEVEIVPPPHHYVVSVFYLTVAYFYEN